MLPAPAQGALALECRAQDEHVSNILRTIEDATARATVTAERAFLNELNASCTAPVAGFARVIDAGRNIVFEGRVGNVMGSRILTASEVGDLDESEIVGQRVAASLIAQGATKLLRRDRGAVHA